MTTLSKFYLLCFAVWTVCTVTGVTAVPASTAATHIAQHMHAIEEAAQ